MYFVSHASSSSTPFPSLFSLVPQQELPSPQDPRRVSIPNHLTPPPLAHPFHPHLLPFSIRLRALLRAFLAPFSNPLSLFRTCHAASRASSAVSLLGMVSPLFQAPRHRVASSACEAPLLTSEFYIAAVQRRNSTGPSCPHPERVGPLWSPRCARESPAGRRRLYSHGPGTWCIAAAR